MPDGALVTLPIPAPVLLTLNVKVVWKVAVQLIGPVIVTEPSVQSAPPDQPTNWELADAVGVKVTESPRANPETTHEDEQLVGLPFETAT
ncbi:hypothetical protein A3I40_02160 [Candidatus Uhrbacteria bacterium RIFCSPLOWO2_02_FULL_48_12]|uniref:Uncharacterized protein n=1 Tax=Candidatus Uhrbacteria bacterium RIFCSPLOWO2_02_FULL_48_12 TaxID=1802407 RepID=A0A1F7V9W9_9BACT|nr:MAG: hypothetical protein A3I40_02160 [Candidatus Uhrbacteria bacterium RIFCSPLOWO2_02_FULL_48_12]